MIIATVTNVLAMEEMVKWEWRYINHQRQVLLAVYR